MSDVFQWIEIVYILYSIASAVTYVFLNVIAMWAIPRYMRERGEERGSPYRIGLEPPVSVLVPAHDEELTIEDSVRSLLQLTYPDHEVLVVNDGSRDRTLENLIRAFDLRPVPETICKRLPTKEVRAVYRSPGHIRLRVIDKENGGKADALNVGINAARYPLFLSLDADSILERDSLLRIVRAFESEPHAVAAGGIVRVANGCRTEVGFMTEVGLAKGTLARIQTVEYLRAFLFGRMGWSPLNGLLVISGAFGLFRKEPVIRAGGYRTGILGEDMELVVRLHRVLSAERTPYRVVFIPDPICWTQVPEDLASLRRQRSRWHRGLCESLTLNLDLMRRGSVAGWLAFPSALLTEMLNPLFLALGYASVLTGWALGFLSLDWLALFLLVELGLGFWLTASAVFLEEISFHVYPGRKDILSMCWAAVLENLGYRQLNAWWRLEGFIAWLTARKPSWGKIRRQGFEGAAKS